MLGWRMSRWVALLLVGCSSAPIPDPPSKGTTHTPSKETTNSTSEITSAEAPPPKPMPTPTFKFKVDAAGSKANLAGDLSVPAGQIQFLVESEKDAYLSVWNVMPDKGMLQFVPNKDEPEVFLKAGEATEVPSKAAKFAFRLEPGTETFVFFASTVPYTTPMAEKEDGGIFPIFRRESENDPWEKTIRPQLLKAIGEKASFAERTLTFEVKAKETNDQEEKDIKTPIIQEKTTEPTSKETKESVEPKMKFAPKVEKPDSKN